MSQEKYTSNKLIYGDWFRAKKKVVNLSGKETRAMAHNDRKPYSIVIGEHKEAPFCFLSLNDKFVMVGFIDEYKREYLDYVFSEIEPGKLFLKEVQYWEHKGTTDEKITSTRYFFTPEGKLTIEEANLVTYEVVTKEAKNKIDVSTHWEDYPEFGKYEKLIIKDRPLPS